MGLMRKTNGRGEQSKKWYGVYRDENGDKRTKSLSKDKAVARQMLAKIEKYIERRRCGLTDDFTDHGKKSIQSHLEAYLGHLRAKGNGKEHIEREETRINRIIDGCGFERITEIKKTKVSQWLENQRETRENFGHQTSNRHQGAMKSFCLWLVGEGRLQANPLAGLKRLNIEVDRRHIRRVMQEGEFSQFLQKVRQSTRVDKGEDWRFTGEERYNLYLTAAMTGLRASELASLTDQSFNFEEGILTVKATISKHRHQDDLPIHPYLKSELESWFKSRRKAEGIHFQLWKGRWAKLKKAGKFIQRDLKEQGIPYRDDDDTVFDFHALRSQFITGIVMTGANVKEAQLLARHSTPVLTLNHYTRLGIRDLARTIDKLPAPISPSTATPNKSAG